MPATQADTDLVPKLANGTRSSPRKRKQQPDDDLAVPWTPSNARKRVRTEALRPLDPSATLQTRSRSDSPKKAFKDLTSQFEFESRQEPPPDAAKKSSKTRPKTETHGHVNLDESTVTTSVNQTSRTQVQVEVAGYTATEVKRELATPSKSKTKLRNSVSDTAHLEKGGQVDEAATAKKSPRRRKTKVERGAEAASGGVGDVGEELGSSAQKTKRKSKVTQTTELEEVEQGDAEVPTKTRRKRKTKEEKEAEAMPLAARTVGLNMFIGAHVSIATGVEKAVTNCVHIGGNAFALFLQSQRKWDNKPLLEENRLAFRAFCDEHKYNASDHVLPHGSYLVNLAHEAEDRASRAYNHFVDDLKRCEALGIQMYNFHPGAAGSAPRSEAINRISAQLNRALAETQTAMPVLENMCGAVIGSRFSDLRDIIAGIKPEYQSRIGVCIDTCHTFAAGYDLRSPAAFQETLQEFDKVVGMRYLKALHVNDSKGPLGSQRDLHQNIGLGFLGLRAFHNVMNEPRFQHKPLILETSCGRIDPSDPTGKKSIDDKAVWAREIKLLESLIGMDPEGDEFKQLEQELSEKGRAAREKMQKAIDQKNDKAERKLEKGQRSLAAMMRKERASTDGSTLSDWSDEDPEP